MCIYCIACFRAIHTHALTQRPLNSSTSVYGHWPLFSWVNNGFEWRHESCRRIRPNLRGLCLQKPLLFVCEQKHAFLRFSICLPARRVLRAAYMFASLKIFACICDCIRVLLFPSWLLNQLHGNYFEVWLVLVCINLTLAVWLYLNATCIVM